MPMLIATQAPATTVPTKPAWLPKIINFKYRGAVETVEVLVYGTLAVHASLPGMKRKPVTITHKPSHLAVAWVDSLEEAQRKVEWMWERCKDVWLEEEIRSFVASIPADVIAWCKENQK